MKNQNKNIKLTVVDLFSGGGIGAMGVKKAGFDILFAIDNNKYAVQSYNQNIKNCCVQADIRKMNIDDIPDSDVILGSPSCQSFSSAGNNKGFNDAKHGDLFSHYIEIIKKKKPKFIVFENVKGILSKKHINEFNLILSELESIGYDMNYKLVNTYLYGVPQLRERVFAVGIRKDLNKKFEFPKEVDEIKRKNIIDAIFDLPQPAKVMTSNKNIQFISKEKEQFANHIGYGIRNDEIEFINKIRIGGNWRDLNEEDSLKFLKKAFYSQGGRTGFLRKVDCTKPAYTVTADMIGKNNSQIIEPLQIITHNICNQSVYCELGYSSRYLSRNRQKQLNEPSFTICSDAKQLPLYPIPKNYDIRNLNQSNVSPPRRFTVRECLRLQSVPDSYVLSEDIPLREQYKIVGNGIPSLYMELLFKMIKNTI